MATISAPDLALLRTTRHATRLYLAVYIPTPIWTAQVDGAQTAGDTTITVKTVAQVRAPQEDYQVLFGTVAGGRDLGEARFKSYGAPVLTVGDHNSTLPNNAYVTVNEFVTPQAKLVLYNPTDVIFEDSNLTWLSDNASKTPLARIGTPAVSWIDPLTGLGTVNFFSDS